MTASDSSDQKSQTPVATAPQRDWPRIIGWGFAIAIARTAGGYLGDALAPDSVWGSAAVPAVLAAAVIVLMVLLDVRRARREGRNPQVFGPSLLLPIAVALAIDVVFDLASIATMIGARG